MFSSMHNEAMMRFCQAKAAQPLFSADPAQNDSLHRVFATGDGLYDARSFSRRTRIVPRKSPRCMGSNGRRPLRLHSSVLSLTWIPTSVKSRNLITASKEVVTEVQYICIFAPNCLANLSPRMAIQCWGQRHSTQVLAMNDSQTFARQRSGSDSLLVHFNRILHLMLSRGRSETFFQNPNAKVS